MALNYFTLQTFKLLQIQKQFVFLKLLTGELPSHKVTCCNRREAYKNIPKKVLDSLGISIAEQHTQRCKASMHVRLASVSWDLDCCPKRELFWDCATLLFSSFIILGNYYIG